MVKKRFPKNYETTSSSDESDSDDFFQEPAEAEPKKYSLRQRKGANFAEDFDYDMLEEVDEKIATDVKALRSDDEDFDVNKAQKEESETNTEPCTQPVPENILYVRKASTPNCTITRYKEREIEPVIPQDKQSSDDMIDFEDIIRADILVNKSRIDYDSIIEKTEIKIKKNQPDTNEIKSNSEKNEKPSFKFKKNGELAKKRGRKPKKAFLEEVDDECYDGRKYKKAKYVEEAYQSYTHENAGLPINTVLGVTESLYELAERYHLQGGIMEEEMEPPPIEPILNENISAGHSKNTLLEGDEVSLNQLNRLQGP